jgi:hypothetical protein
LLKVGGGVAARELTKGAAVANTPASHSTRAIDRELIDPDIRLLAFPVVQLRIYHFANHPSVIQSIVLSALLQAADKKFRPCLSSGVIMFAPIAKGF